jgi:hypothetical protein
MQIAERVAGYGGEVDGHGNDRAPAQRTLQVRIAPEDRQLIDRAVAATGGRLDRLRDVEPNDR